MTGAGPRDRLIASAITLVRERGVEGTGLTELIEHSGAARRSIYQHFPDGKLELVAASTAAAGRWVKHLIRSVGQDRSPAESLGLLVEQIAGNLQRRDFTLGCPVGAAALAVPEAAAVRTAAVAAFGSWIEEIAAGLVRAGWAEPEARSLAGFAVSAVEGALLRSRAERSTEPLEQVAAHLVPLFAYPRNGSAG